MAELLIHLFAIAVMTVRGERYYQWMLTLLFMLSIAIATSGHSYLNKWMNRSKMVSLLGNLSMSIYLVHVPVIRLCRHVFDMSVWSYGALIPLFTVILAVALFHYFGTEWLTAGVTKWIFWLKRSLTM